MKKAWLRELRVILTSNQVKSNKVRRLTFGNNCESGREDLSIRVTCNKYLSSMKDEAIVEISNLTYSELTNIINGQFYNIEIQCGYRHANVQSIFSGVIFYISNKLDDTKTNTVILICTSHMVGRFGQRLINLGLNSGINMYTQIKYIIKKAGIHDASISGQLYKTLLEKATTVTDTASGFTNALMSEYDTMMINIDKAVSGATISIFDASKSNRRVIKLSEDLVNLSGGYPRLTNEGLEISLMPTFAFMCGDTIQIDNSIIDIHTSNKSEVTKQYGFYLDDESKYMIMSMRYVLENRGSQFGLELQCKSRNIFQNITN